MIILAATAAESSDPLASLYEWCNFSFASVTKIQYFIIKRILKIYIFPTSS